MFRLYIIGTIDIWRRVFLDLLLLGHFQTKGKFTSAFQLCTNETEEERSYIFAFNYVLRMFRLYIIGPTDFIVTRFLICVYLAFS